MDSLESKVKVLLHALRMGAVAFGSVHHNNNDVRMYNINMHTAHTFHLHRKFEHLNISFPQLSSESELINKIANVVEKT